MGVPSVCTYRIVLADDQPSLRQIVRKLLSGGKHIEVVGEAGDGKELLRILQDCQPPPDLVILDISMPEMRGIEAAREIRSRFPEIRVLMLTVHAETEYVCQAFAAGAVGYIMKEEADTELFEAIRAIRGGGIYKSARLRDAVA